VKPKASPTSLPIEIVRTTIRSGEPITIAPKPTIHVINDALGSIGFFFNFSFAPYIHKIIPGIKNAMLDIIITMPPIIEAFLVVSININNPINRTNTVPATNPIPIHQNLLNFFMLIISSN
jgi:hypothetical protein